MFDGRAKTEREREGGERDIQADRRDAPHRKKGVKNSQVEVIFYECMCWGTG